jgi:DNA repair exonuclease SbcCD nuclease subunit
MFRFIHTADIHLDSPLKGLESYEDAPVEEIRGATRRAFDQLVSFAIDEHVAFMVIAGDLYDGDWKDYNTGLFFISRMAQLARAGIQVFIVAGNHDAASQITKSLPLPDNVFLFASNKPHSIMLEDLKTVIHGRSYHTKSETSNLALTYPKKLSGYLNIGLLHTSLTGREGHEQYAPCQQDELIAKDYDYWALGHVHTREIVCSDPWIVFPGNLQGRHIRETGRKGATLVTVDHDEIQDVSHHVFDVVRWQVCDISLSRCNKAEEIHNLVHQTMLDLHQQAAGKVLVLRLVLSGTTSMHSQLLEHSFQWEEECKAIAAGLGEIWLEQIRIQTTPPENHLTGIDRDTVLGTLLQTISELEITDQALLDLVPELSPLRNKLPVSLSQEPVTSLCTDEDNPASLKNELQELLLSRLIDGSEL